MYVYDIRHLCSSPGYSYHDFVAHIKDVYPLGNIIPCTIMYLKSILEVCVCVCVCGEVGGGVGTIVSVQTRLNNTTAKTRDHI